MFATPLEPAGPVSPFLQEVNVMLRVIAMNVITSLMLIALFMFLFFSVKLKIGWNTYLNHFFHFALKNELIVVLLSCSKLIEGFKK